MRKFFYISIGLPLMGIILSSCSKYQSSIEAINACEEWVKAGDEFILQGISNSAYIPGKGYRTTKLSESYRPIRYCEEDTKTRKYLGITQLTRELQDSPVRNIKKYEVFEIGCDDGFRDCATTADYKMEDIKVERRFSY